MILNLEDCLEYLAGLRESPVKFTIEKTDATIMNSIARQCFKGTALTDRQSALMHEKLQTYRDQFINLDWDFDYAVNQLRQPLRSIDRSKYITIRDNRIIVRFPFSKTNIVSIEQVVYATNSYEYEHAKGSHEHIFPYTESAVMHLLDKFASKEFTIDQVLLDMYTEIKAVHAAPQQHLSGIANGKLINIKDSLVPIIKEELGELTNETFTQFIDRRFRYGFNYTQPAEGTTLAHKIACRTGASYQSKPSQESIEDILTALWQLNRFPLLIVLDKNNAEECLHAIANYYRDILDPSEQSVLFRLEDADAGFNQLVKDRKLNNWVDKTTKIVYTSTDKLPKLLVNSEWKPSAALCFNSHLNKFVSSYVEFNCDLLLFREETMSPFRRHWWPAAN